MMLFRTRKNIVSIRNGLLNSARSPGLLKKEILYIREWDYIYKSAAAAAAATRMPLVKADDMRRFFIGRCIHSSTYIIGERI